MAESEQELAETTSGLPDQTPTGPRKENELDVTSSHHIPELCGLTRETLVEICHNRDKSYNGKFFLGVSSTRIVCNPGCPSKVPLEKHMEFFETVEKAFQAGYRPCKCCMKEYWRS